MGTCMGLARVMEQLGLLTPLRDERTSSQDVVKLGHGSPRKAYRLTFSKEIIADVIKKCGTITWPERLATAVLKDHIEQMSFVFQTWPVSRRKAKTVGKKITKVTKSVGTKLRNGKAVREAYAVKHFLRKHVS